MKKQFKNWIILVMLGIAIITGSGIMRGVRADKIDVKAAYMIDAGTGQVLYQQNADSKYPIASLTKILTLAVIMKDIHNQKLSWDQKIKVNLSISTSCFMCYFFHLFIKSLHTSSISQS